jgi:hypothetical protein
MDSSDRFIAGIQQQRDAIGIAGEFPAAAGGVGLVGTVLNRSSIA